MRKRLLSIAILFICSLATVPALALGLPDAKAQGLVGERIDGYLGIVVNNPAPELTNLVKIINQKRKQAYTKSAGNAGVSLNAMEQRIGQRLIDKTPGNFYFQDVNGHWKKK
jgi:hypothetical protein